MDESDLLTAPRDQEFATVERPCSSYHSLDSFKLPEATQRKYTTQYADLYFVRLALLKHHVERVAEEAWSDYEFGGEKARRVERVLDVRQGELCWVVGTVFMDMVLKPSVLDDLTKEQWIVAPPVRHKYIASDGKDQIMLEDESGRLQLAGSVMQRYDLCTGCIIAAIGTENKDGAFEIIDIKLADLPAQPGRWSLAPKPEKRDVSQIAIVSGLELDGVYSDTLTIDLLQEYLVGEAGESQSSCRISRLLLVGNSLSEANPIPAREETNKKSTKKYGLDPSAWNSSPVHQLDQFLSTVLPSLPITLVPGASDPATVSFPQQPLHAAFFPASRAYIQSPQPGQGWDGPSWFDSVTNPWEGEVAGWRILATGGQPVNDMFKYVDNDDRLKMMECFLRWRNVAPTAPDTLWTYPFQDKDPFVLQVCPHVFIVGDQPQFGTSVIEGPQNQSVRLITVPSFRETGLVILLDSETLEVDCIKFDIFGKDVKTAPELGETQNGQPSG